MINAVEALRRYVKKIMDKAKEPTTTYGVTLLLPEADEPTTTGKSGKMHGASTVSTPAINETARKVMLFYSRQNGRKFGRVIKSLDKIA